MEMTGYRSCSLELEPGDTIFVYTDGVTEAENSEKRSSSAWSG
jgi:serine phosphatase RsbU (regulator of sigma subunit)